MSLFMLRVVPGGSAASFGVEQSQLLYQRAKLETVYLREVKVHGRGRKLRAFLPAQTRG